MHVICSKAFSTFIFVYTCSLYILLLCLYPQPTKRAVGVLLGCHCGSASNVGPELKRITQQPDDFQPDLYKKALVRWLFLYQFLAGSSQDRRQATRESVLFTLF